MEASVLGESRQFTDKTVHRQGFWRQFTDRIEDSSPTLLKTVHRPNFVLYLYIREVEKKSPYIDRKMT